VYVTTDSFTSQYQSKIYKTYGKVDQYHMMFGVNMWSTCISLASIILAGEAFYNSTYDSRHINMGNMYLFIYLCVHIFCFR
jgi:hypothetical protein